MPAFNFMKTFAPALRSGQKPTTFRADRRDGRPPAKVGDKAYLYTGMRTKSCERLAVHPVVSVKKAMITCKQIENERLYSLYIDGLPVSSEVAMDEIARLDGFCNWQEMVTFFDKTHGMPFSGWYIAWDPARRLDTN